MSNQKNGTEQNGHVCGCKVGRNIEKYELNRFDEKLLEQRDDGASLRHLESVVNKALLRSALEDSRRDFIGDVDSIYERLTDAEMSAGKRAETADQLSRGDVDVDELLSDFVSYQTVRTHLQDCLEVDTRRGQSLNPEDARGTIEWARSRSEGIIERTIERLSGVSGFQSGDVDVTYTVRVSCPDCKTSSRIEAFIERGGCQCSVEGATDE